MSQLHSSFVRPEFGTGEDTHICVLTECPVSPPNLAKVFRLLQRLRAQAMASPGYLSGTLWQDVKDPYRVIILDGWQSVEQWDNFRNAAESRDIQEELETLLAGPAIVRHIREPPK